MILDASQILSQSKKELAQLNSASTPILVIEDSFHLSPSINPGLTTIGIMLPTTPLHWSLLRSTRRPLVVTSGNTEGDPIVHNNESAQQALSKIASYLLHHDRDIIRPVDDSVVRVIAEQPVTIRAARGRAPLPLNIDGTKSILAVGGQQKVAIALSNGCQSVLGPHIGDLDSLSARERFVTETKRFCQLYRCQPEIIAHDLHPDYFTTRWAAEQELPTIAVQHHHAHIVTGMIEHGWLDQRVLGIACDGTGYGTDGTIWGGEVLIASARDMERVGSFRRFILPGGEAAIREPWRIACALLAQAIGPEAGRRWLRTKNELATAGDIQHLISSAIGPMTSSLGRLFDGVAAIVLGVTVASYEGEPAALLETACDIGATGCYELPVDQSAKLAIIDWRRLIEEIVADIDKHVPSGTIAMRFHRSIANALAAIASAYDLKIVIGGGCFQNRILTELLAGCLQQHTCPVGLPGKIPPNDGGLAAGQLAIAHASL